MRNSILRQARPFLLLSALTALSALTTNAQAAAFRTTWDPVFNDSFSTLVGVSVGWRGTADITVDDGCVASSAIVSFPGGCGTATLDSYELEFYDVITDIILGTGTGSSGLPGVSKVSFDAMSIADGLEIGSAIDVGAFSFGSYSNSFDAFLDFGLDGPSLTLVENCYYIDDVGSSGCASFVNDSEIYPPTVTWEAIPTPASLPLFGIGLFALVLMRRSGKA